MGPRSCACRRRSAVRGPVNQEVTPIPSGSVKAYQQETRQRLLAEARRIFLKVGYQATTLDEIARAAGFTKGAVYWHFPNKRALFLATVAESVEANLGTLEALLVSAPKAPDKLKEKFGEWIDGIDERESLPTFGAELEIESRRDPEVRAIHQRMIVEHEEKLAAFVERYFSAVGETPTMAPIELSRTLITVFKGFALSRQNRPVDPPSSALVARHLLGLPMTPKGRMDGQA